MYHGQLDFVAQGAAERGFAQGAIDGGLGPQAHFRQPARSGGEDVLDQADDPGRVAMLELPADLMTVDQFSGMAARGPTSNTGRPQAMAP